MKFPSALRDGNTPDESGPRSGPDSDQAGYPDEPADGSSTGRSGGVFPARIPAGRIFLGGILPLVIYHLLSRAGHPVAGAAAGAATALAVACGFAIAHRRAEIYSLIGGTFALIELVVTLAGDSEIFFLLAPALYALLLAAFFALGSLPQRPVLQILAEESVGPDTFGEELRASVYFIRCWRLLSLIWAGTYLAKAVILYTLFATAPESVLLSARVLLGWPLWAGLFILSLNFPGRYWRNRGLIKG